MFRLARKGLVLLLLLATILFTTILAGICSYLVLNQSRLGQHQINRIKAYYAALAGINLALEKLRGGYWNNTPTTPWQPYTICRNSITPRDCNPLLLNCSNLQNCTTAGNIPPCYEEDWDMPYRVDINITDLVNGSRTVTATVDYTYTQ
jgi:hypothetical protein